MKPQKHFIGKRPASYVRLISRVARWQGNQRFQTSDKRMYEMVNGSLRVLNKPPSRVKRRREGLAKTQTLKAA